VKFIISIWKEIVSDNTLVECAALPVQMDEDDQLALKRSGVKFLGPIEGDDLFERVTLPEGWAVAETEITTVYELLDEYEKPRAIIHYSSNYYKRSAWLIVTCRFGIVADDEHELEGNAVRMCVTDYGEVTFESDVHTFNVDSTEQFEAANESAINECREWLDENYHDWKNPLAYHY
jgi:hypothetical protein